MKHELPVWANPEHQAKVIHDASLITARQMLGTGQPLTVYSIMWASVQAQWLLGGGR